MLFARECFRMPLVLLWFEQLTSSSAPPRSTEWSNTEVFWEHPIWNTCWQHTFKRKRGKKDCSVSVFKDNCQPFLEETFEAGRNDRCGKTLGRKQRGTNVLPQWTLLPKRPWSEVGSNCWHFPLKSCSYQKDFPQNQPPCPASQGHYCKQQVLCVAGSSVAMERGRIIPETEHSLMNVKSAA